MAKIGERFVFRDLEFWPATGLIYIMDYRDKCAEDDRFKVETRPEFVARLIGINDQVRKEQYSDERKEMQNLILDMVACSRLAREQGDPTDPEASRDLVMQNKRVVFQANYDPANHSSTISRLYAALPTYDPGVPAIPQALPDTPIKSME